MKKTIKFIPTLLAASIGLALPSAQAAINGKVTKLLIFVELKFSLIRIYPYQAHHGLQIQSAIQP